MILVTGATGSIGRYLVRHLKARGARFKAFVRDKARGEALGCDYAVGDLNQPDTLRAALTGVERLFLNVNASGSMVAQQTAAIDAAKAAGVSHVVKLSTPGADPGSPLSLGRWHGEIEAHLQSSGVAWTSLQPVSFMQNVLNHAASIQSDGRFFGAYKEGRMAFIDCDDIGASAAAVLTGSGHTGKAFVLTGREALTHAEVARKLSTKLGKPVTYVDLPVEQMVASMKAKGMPARFAEDLGAMMASFATGTRARTTSAVKELTGNEPRTFDQFLDDNLDAFRA